MTDWKPEPVPDDEIPISAFRPKKGGWIFGVIALLLAGAGEYYWWSTHQAPVVQEVLQVVVDAGADEPDAGPVISLAEGEGLLNKLFRSLSSSPEFQRWLSSGELISRLTAAVNLVADGESPKPMLGFLTLKGNFSVVGRKHLFIAPKSYGRYDLIVQAFNSVDAVAAGHAYGQLKPYFNSVYAGIGRPGVQFDDVLGSAIRRLTATKIPDGDIELVPKGAVYAFKETELEELSAAQKQLIRMGPANAKAIQAELTRFAEAAGLKR